MTREEIKKEFIEIVVDFFDISREDVKEESSFRDDFGADSLDEVELLMEVERTFVISIPDEEIESAQPDTVGKAIDLIEKIY